MEGSPADRSGALHVGDRILSVNSMSVSHLHHELIVNMIKDSGQTVVLTVGPPGSPLPVIAPQSVEIVYCFVLCRL